MNGYADVKRILDACIIEINSMKTQVHIHAKSGYVNIYHVKRLGKVK